MIAPVIRTRHLCKSYLDGQTQIQVLDDIELAVAPATSVAITGPSGSGKSTLLNILAGLIAADSGEIVLNVGDQEFALHTCSTRRRTQIRRAYIGYVFQFFNLIPTLTVLENVLLPAELNKRGNQRDEAMQLLEHFGMASRCSAFPQTLSGGEQQRVAVARALLLRPPLLLADEPTGNLDQHNATLVANMLFEAARLRDVALVVATHSDSVAALAQQHMKLLKRS